MQLNNEHASNSNNQLLEILGDICYRRQEYKRAVLCFSKLRQNCSQIIEQPTSTLLDDVGRLTYKICLCELSDRSQHVRSIDPCKQICKENTELRQNLIQQLETIPFEKRDVKINLLMGTLYKSMSLIQSAITAFKAVLRSFPESIEIVEVLIRLGVEESDILSSFDDKSRSVELFPYNITWMQFYVRAIVSQRNLDFPSALSNWTTLLDSHRDNIFFFRKYAESLLLSSSTLTLSALASKSQAANTGQSSV